MNCNAEPARLDITFKAWERKKESVSAVERRKNKWSDSSREKERETEQDSGKKSTKKDSVQLLSICHCV